MLRSQFQMLSSEFFPMWLHHSTSIVCSTSLRLWLHCSVAFKWVLSSHWASERFLLIFPGVLGGLHTSHWWNAQLWLAEQILNNVFLYGEHDWKNIVSKIEGSVLAQKLWKLVVTSWVDSHFHCHKPIETSEHDVQGLRSKNIIHVSIQKHVLAALIAGQKWWLDYICIFFAQGDG